MESITYFKNIKMTPKKLRMLVPQIKKLSPTLALQTLQYTPKRSAKVFYKAIHSALANAKQTLKVDESMLQFKILSVDEGQKLKRYNPGSRGTAKPYIKRFAHIKVVLETSPQKVQAPVVEKAAKVKSEVAEKQTKMKTEKKQVKAKSK